ncbi:MAG: lipase family protein, partial [Candidatus Competibacterales bacterium]
TRRAGRPGGAVVVCVHAGFHGALEWVWGDVTSALAVVGGDDPALWIAGHSLGGGLAPLAAAKLAEERRAHEVAGVYTIGQPRVGSGAFADSYNEHYGDNTFRIVHNNDIVTRIPPLLSGYEHVGTQKYINHEGELDPDLGFWGRVWDRAQGRWDAIGESGSDGIADHDSGRYIEFLSRALELEGN